ncbi:lipid II flippase MurJ [Mesorhizobium sp. A556]
MRSALSFTGEGVIAAFNYATKLVELPLGVAITSITTVAFTRLSDQFAASKSEEAETMFATATVAATLVGISICIPAICFSHPLTELVFARGRMTADDINLVSDLAAIGMLTIPLVAISGMAAAMLNAQKKSGLGFRCTLISLLVLPFAIGPGFLLSDARLAMLALPIFHLVLAAILARAARLRVSRPALQQAGRRLLALRLACGGAIALDLVFSGMPAIIRVALALAAMAMAVLLSGARSTLSSLRL